MSHIKDGYPDDIPPVPATTGGERFDNAIRRYGVVNACEWFGHSPDSEFTLETIRVLRERSIEAGVLKP